MVLGIYQASCKIGDRMKPLYLTLMILLNTVLVFSQSQLRPPYVDSVVAQIQPLVRSEFGNQYSIDVSVFDSLTGTTTPLDGELISDPYGTLQHCIMFYASKDTIPFDSSFVGIYKGGAIIWHSNPIMYGVGSLFSAQDINKGGMVDLVTTWSSPEENSLAERMWIFSWNGSSGSVINAIDTTKLKSIKYRSRIWGYSFSLLDVDSSGVKVISSDVGDSTVYYYWNGTSYGQGFTNQQVSPNTFLPANLLTTNVKASTSLETTKFRYSYHLTNNNLSKQTISSFYIVGVDTPYSSLQPQSWRFGTWTDTSVVQWYAMEGLANWINPGQTNDSLALFSPRLPHVVTYLVQGNRTLPSLTLPRSAFQSDVFSNSFSGHTIAPKESPSPFDGMGFLDTLKSYINQSRSLGWIATDDAGNKYTTLVDSMKAQIARGDSAKAHITGNTVLADAIQDSSTVLSSEAFALIYFNTQYLVSLLPAAPSQQWIFATSYPGGLIVDASGEGFTPPTLTYNDTTEVDTFVVPTGQDMPFYIDTVAGYYIDSLYIDGVSQT